jgi:fructose-1,6-bisphosphatase/inositol monophosphatase family enzyme
MGVAEGEVDALVDATASQIWDRAPLVVLVEEAGGRFRDRNGGTDLCLPGGLFTNGHVDDQLDVLLAER